MEIENEGRYEFEEKQAVREIIERAAEVARTPGAPPRGIGSGNTVSVLPPSAMTVWDEAHEVTKYDFMLRVDTFQSVGAVMRVRGQRRNYAK